MTLDSDWISNYNQCYLNTTEAYDKSSQTRGDVVTITILKSMRD